MFSIAHLGLIRDDVLNKLLHVDSFAFRYLKCKKFIYVCILMSTFAQFISV